MPECWQCKYFVPCAEAIRKGYVKPGEIAHDEGYCVKHRRIVVEDDEACEYFEPYVYVLGVIMSSNLNLSNLIGVTVRYYICAPTRKNVIGNKVVVEWVPSNWLSPVEYSLLSIIEDVIDKDYYYRTYNDEYNDGVTIVMDKEMVSDKVINNIYGYMTGIGEIADVRVDGDRKEIVLRKASRRVIDAILVFAEYPYWCDYLCGKYAKIVSPPRRRALLLEWFNAKLRQEFEHELTKGSELIVAVSREPVMIRWYELIEDDEGGVTVEEYVDIYTDTLAETILLRSWQE